MADAQINALDKDTNIVALDAKTDAGKVTPMQGSRDGAHETIGAKADAAAADDSSAASLVALLKRLNGKTPSPPSQRSRILSAAASTNATGARATAGRLHTVTGHNASAGVLWLKIYDKASAPTVGTDTPALTIALPVGTFSFNFNGYAFAVGIAYALTTGSADANTGALAAGDVLGLTITFGNL